MDWYKFINFRLYLLNIYFVLHKVHQKMKEGSRKMTRKIIRYIQRLNSLHE